MARYTARFYGAIADEGVGSARVVVPLVLDLVGPVERVADVGCGVGSWLSVFVEHSATHVLGLDGDYVPRDLLRIPADRFLAADLTRSLPVEDRFDLAVCLEVAEHLPASRARSFVEELTALAPVVLFSAAIPFQGGTGHVNEQWPAYWAELFDEQGYACADALRDQVWDDDRVSSCIAQNVLLFADRSSLSDRPRLVEAVAATRTESLARVHPDRYLLVADPTRLSLRRLARAAFPSMVGALRRR